MTSTFTRQQLYELVWQRPVRTLAKELGVSDVGLAKACRRANIPLPGLGYWAKLAAGHRLTRIPLPQTTDGRSEVRIVATPPKPTKIRLEERVAATETPADVAAITEPKSSYSLVLSDFTAPHTLLRGAQAQLTRRKPDGRGLAHARLTVGWQISVAPESATRALIVADTLLKALKTQGAVVCDGQQERWQTEVPKVLQLEGEPVVVSVREHVKQRRRTDAELARLKQEGEAFPTRMEYRPSGGLIVAMPNAPYQYAAEWRDSKSTPIESQLPSIVTALFALPKALIAQRKEKEARDAELREAERRRLKEAERERRKKERLAELVKEALALQEYRAVVGYLKHLERAVGSGEYLVTEKLTKGLETARELVGRLDPTERRIALLQKFGMVTQGETWYLRADEEAGETD